MDTKSLKAIGAAMSLLAGVGSASPALATSTGPETLGAPATAADAWCFVCPAFTYRVSAHVHDTRLPIFNFPANMKVQVGKAAPPLAGLSGVATDVLPFIFNGEGGLPSPNAVKDGGPGLYTVAFFKDAAGGESYIGDVVCKRRIGHILLPDFHPVLTAVPQQNQ